MDLDILECSVQNLRGYPETSFSFKDLTLLVGENNHGKSSILKMIHSLLQNVDESLAKGNRALSEQEYALWVPASNDNKKARRLTLTIGLRNGKFQKRFEPFVVEEKIELRLSVLPGAWKARLNLGPAKSGEKPDELAFDFLKELRTQWECILIPAVRDASSLTFTTRLAEKVTNSIRRKLDHKKAAGAPKEYRAAKAIVNKLRVMVSSNADEVDLMNGFPLMGQLVESSELRFDVGHSKILEFIESGLQLVLSTGAHDALRVDPKEVGNGLQSIIDLSFTIRDRVKEDKLLLLMLEEPEAFLHPRAQRDLISNIRSLVRPGKGKIVFTTHSPIVIDECQYPEVVLVRDRKFFPPKKLNDDRRAQINSNLMCAKNGESFFANYVLLVEGPGDKAFLDVIFRKIRDELEVYTFNGLVVQEVGGKRSFAPWINLFRSYGNEGQRPIKWLCLFDADAVEKDDAGVRALTRGLLDGGQVLPSAVHADIESLADISYLDLENRLAKATKLNKELADFHAHVFSVDMEWSIFESDLSPNRDRLSNALVYCGLDDAASVSVTEMAQRLGSKVGTGSSRDRARKEPYIRAKLASDLELKTLPFEVKQLVERVAKEMLPLKEVRKLRETGLF